MTQDDLLTLAQRLREYNHNPHHINPVSDAFHRLITDSADALSQLAAIQGGKGEAVGFDRNAAYAACPESGCDWGSFYVGWKAAAAQHQRITAAMAAEVERLSEERDSCRDMAGCMDMFRKDMIERGVVGEQCPPMFMTEGVCSFIGGIMRERDALRAELAEVKGREAVAVEGVTVERDMMGTMHIKIGDFDFIQIQYQYPYTDNASTKALAERISSLLTTPPASPDVEGLVNELQRIAEKCSDPDTTDALDTALSTWRQAQEGKP